MAAKSQKVTMKSIQIEMIALKEEVESVKFELKNVKEELEKSKKEVNRGIAAFGVVLMWFKAFYWLRIFTGTSFYVRLIRDTLYDIRNFIILFILILLTFANALLILNEGRDQHLYMDFFNIDIANAVMNQYMLSLGEFDVEGYNL